MSIEREHVIKFLRTVPLFHESTDEQLGALADVIQCRSYEAGHEILPDGAAHELFIAVQGEYQILLHQAHVDVEAELARLYPGDYFGDLALFLASRRG